MVRNSSNPSEYHADILPQHIRREGVYRLIVLMYQAWNDVDDQNIGPATCTPRHWTGHWKQNEHPASFKVVCSSGFQADASRICTQTVLDDKTNVIIGAVIGACVLIALSVGGWYARKNKGSVIALIKSFLMNEAFLLIGSGIEILDYASTHTRCIDNPCTVTDSPMHCGCPYKDVWNTGDAIVLKGVVSKGSMHKETASLVVPYLPCGLHCAPACMFLSCVLKVHCLFQCCLTCLCRVTGCEATALHQAISQKTERCRCHVVGDAVGSLRSAANDHRNEHKTARE